ncbi:MAG: ribose-phosphate diphosphokinase [Aigarchaeota archaeon]|nr:ribose-phosphate diphosphokinase [Aigarchaeota archaeon]MDW8092354.1 ribose-phosphate diphosphokinase [Nitrososphaerota archaeon]
MLVVGPSSEKLGQKISKILRVEPVRLIHKTFPDGESYFRVTDKVGGHVVLVQGTHPPQDRHLVQTVLLCQGLRDLGADRLTVVMPYLAYARQDKTFLEGEVVSLKVVINLLRSSGVERVITVNPHSPWALQDGLISFKIVDAVPRVCEYLKHLIERPAIVLSPGKKGEAMAREAASVLDVESSHVKSFRDPERGDVRVEIGVGDLRGYTVLLIDDLISTGGTMIRLIEAVRSMGARRVIAACVHGLFVGGADSKVFRAGADMILSTDTVDTPYSKVSVAEPIADLLAYLR